MNGYETGWKCVAKWLPDRLKGPVEGSESFIYAKEVIIAAGGMTDHVMSLIVEYDKDEPNQTYKMFKNKHNHVLIIFLGLFLENISMPLVIVNPTCCIIIS